MLVKPTEIKLLLFRFIMMSMLFLSYFFVIDPPFGNWLFSFKFLSNLCLLYYLLADNQFVA